MTTFRFQLRRGTSAQWATADPVLAPGEPGVDLDTRELKIGDGVTAWADLPIQGDPAPALDAVAAEAAARDAALGGKVDKGSIVVNVMDYGATGDGVTDDTAAVVSAFSAAQSRRVAGLGGSIHRPGATVLLPPGKTFNLSTLADPIVVSCNVVGAGATLVAPQAYAQAVLVVGHETAGNVLHTADLSLPDVSKGAYLYPYTAGSTGVKVQNLYHSRVRFGRVTRFETGHHYTGLDAGTAYNTFHPGWVDLCKVGWRLQPDPTGFPSVGGFVNQNTWVGGGISQSADGQTPTSRRSGFRHLLLDGGAGHTVHGNTFVGASFEGDISEYFIEFANAAENIFHGSTRFELTTPGSATAVSAAFNSFTIAGGAMGLVAGDMVVFTGTSAPGGITFDTPYYVYSVLGDDFDVTTTPGGGGLIVDVTSDGTGVVTHRPPTIRFDNSSGYTRDNIVRDYNSYPGPLEVKRTGAAAPAAKQPIVG